MKVRARKRKMRKLRNTIIAYIFLIILSIIIFFYCHEYANTLRPSNAYGGELTAFLLPFIVWATRRNIKDFKKNA